MMAGEEREVPGFKGSVVTMHDNRMKTTCEESVRLLPFWSQHSAICSYLGKLFRFTWLIVESTTMEVLGGRGMELAEVWGDTRTEYAQRLV